MGKNQNEDVIKEGFIDDVILQMILEKTGLVFLKPQYGIHYLIPGNLREVQHYISFLASMSDLNDVPSDMEVNLNRFEDYFIHQWALKYLSDDYVNFINSFTNEDLVLKNKFIVIRLIDLIVMKSNEKNNDVIYKNLSLRESEAIRTIIQKSNNPCNISIGDVLFVLKFFATERNEEEAYRLVFAIKTLYSIYLTKLIKIEKDYENARILLGGSIYEFKTINFIRNKRNEFDPINFVNTNREHIEDLQYDVLKLSQNGPTIKEVIDKINVKKGEIIENSKKNNQPVSKEVIPIATEAQPKEEVIENSVIEDILVKEFQIVEWLHYFVIYIGQVDSRSGFGLNDFRNSENIYYNSKKLGFNVKYFTVNILSFITNLLQPSEKFNQTFGFLFSDSADVDITIPKFTLLPSIKEWVSKYGTVIPLNSIEFIENLLDDLSSEIEAKDKKRVLEPEYEEYEKFELVIKCIATSMEKILDKNNIDELQKNNILDAYKTCPLISFIFSDIQNTNKFDKEDIKKIWSRLNNAGPILMPQLISSSFSNSIPQNDTEKYVAKSKSSKEVSNLLYSRVNFEEIYKDIKAIEIKDEDFEVRDQDVEQIKKLYKYFISKNESCDERTQINGNIETLISIMLEYKEYKKVYDFIGTILEVKSNLKKKAYSDDDIITNKNIATSEIIRVMKETLEGIGIEL